MNNLSKLQKQLNATQEYIDKGIYSLASDSIKKAMSLCETIANDTIVENNAAKPDIYGTPLQYAPYKPHDSELEKFY